MEKTLTGFRKPIDITNTLRNFNGNIKWFSVTGRTPADITLHIKYSVGENQLLFAHKEGLRSKSDVDLFATQFKNAKMTTDVQWHGRDIVVFVAYEAEETHNEPAVVSQDPRVQKALRKVKDGCDKQRTEALKTLNEMAAKDHDGDHS